MRAAHLRQRTVVRASDPMPGVCHNPHRTWGSSASGSRCCCSRIFGPSTSRVPRPAAFCRGDPGHASACPWIDPNQTTRGAPTQKGQPCAEICSLCPRVGGAGRCGLHLPAIAAEQGTGQHEFQTDPSYSQPQCRGRRPLGRSERRNGRVGRSGRRRLISAAPGPGPTPSGRPNPNAPRRQPRSKVHEQHLPSEAQTAQVNRLRRWRASAGRLSPQHRPAIG